jgi:acetylornithine deacetylase
VVPGEASAELQIRLVSEAEPIRKILEAAVAGRAEIEYLSEHEPVHLLAVEGFEQCVVRFTTDIPYLSEWGKPLLVGPGSILNAHTQHEFVLKRELIEAVDIYARLTRLLMASAPEAREALGGTAK